MNAKRLVAGWCVGVSAFAGACVAPATAANEQNIIMVGGQSTDSFKAERIACAYNR